MIQLKYIYISFSLLTLLLSLAVESHNIHQKWSVGNHFGYEGGFCLPGLCIRGSGGGRVHYGDAGVRYNGRNRGIMGYRQSMYCKPLNCWAGSCDAIHLHLDKGLYESLIAKHSSPVDYIPETFKYNVNNINDFKEDTAMAPQQSN